MEIGDWIATAGVVVAMASAVVAVLQAASAKRQAVIAQGAAASAREQAAAAWEQARSSAESAEAAQRQATAAEEQLELMRRQAELEEAGALEATRPEFQVEEARLQFTGEWYFTARVRMVRGPALASVVATARGEEVRGLTRWVDDRDKWQKERSWTHLSAGALLEVVAQMNYHVSRPANLTIDFRCLEHGDQPREWTCTATASASDVQGESDERSAAGW